MTGGALQVGDRVWVGVPANELPGHILSICQVGSGRVEYVVRTLDLDGRPGENLNLRVYDGQRPRVLRPRPAGAVVAGVARAVGVRHVSH
jgi:hypothetical protein